MGQPKLTMPYGTSTVIGTVVEAVASSGVDDLVVVTGFHAAAVTSVLPDGTRTAHNERAARGNASSLQTGLQLVGDVDGVIVAVGDMPGIAVASIDQLLGLWRRSTFSLCVIEYLDGRGHPLLIDSSLFSEIEELSGERALWAFAESLEPSTVGLLRLPTAKPADINSLEDYQGAVRALGLG